MSRQWIVWWATVVAAVAWCALPGEALAESYTVTSSSDNSFSAGTTFCATPQPGGTSCTLRAAIQQLNALGSGPHTITLPPRHYTLVQNGGDDTALDGDLDVTANITINGAGAATTIVQACDADAATACLGIDRVFDVRPGGTLTMSGVTVRKGFTSSSGGGIVNRGTLVLRFVVLDKNRADNGGGGLSNLSSTATAALLNVSVTNNRAGDGAGIENFEGILSLTNVTISGNTSTVLSGGGLYQSGGDSTLRNVTVAANGAPDGGGGIVLVSGGTLRASNSIIANNTDTTTGRPYNCIIFSGSSVISQGFNLAFPGPDCDLAAGTNDQFGDPKLGLLQDNGGGMPTMALLPGSAAIDAGNQATPLNGQSGHCTASDARGLARTADGDLNGIGRCDIGAYELASFTVNAIADLDDVAPGNLVCATTFTSLCTLRAAVREANALGGGAISLPANTYTLSQPGTGEDAASTGDLDITGGITIKGAQGRGSPSTIIQACDVAADPNCLGIDRVFEVRPGGSLTMSGVTVRNGLTTSSVGGGIVNQGTLVLIDAALDHNSGLAGGGLNNNGAAAMATLTNVSVTNNHATGVGGGIDNLDGVLSLTNVTISGNSSAMGAGALAQGGSGSPTTTLANVTVANNVADRETGGIKVAAGQVTVLNSIVANNAVNGGGFSNCVGTFASGGFNLVFPGSGCGFTQATDKQNQDPKLGALKDNGGPTPTMALLAGSAALDAGSTVPPGGSGPACAPFDQRGFRRLEDGDLDGSPRCDIGAFEARLTDLCAQRPPVRLAVARNGTGGLSVTVTAGLGRLTELHFHDGPPAHVPSPNVLVDIGGQTGRSGDFSFIPPGGITQQAFTLRRASGTGSATLPFDAFDACGAWPTFVGGGPSAFGGTGSLPDPVTAPAVPPGRDNAPPAPGEACAWFPSQAAAQAYLRADPGDPLNLDRSHNGIACEGADGAGFVNQPLDRVPVLRQ